MRSRGAGCRRRVVAPCLAAALSVGCGSDDDGGIAPGASDPDGDDRPGLIVRGLGGPAPEAVPAPPWFVSTDYYRDASEVPTEGEVDVQLLRYDGDVTLALFVDFYTRELDVCELRRDGGGDGGGGGSPPGISGGASVTINAPSGPWLVLDRTRVDDGRELLYRRPYGELPGALPAGATLSIPGDVFPNVAAYPLGEPPLPMRLLPDENDALDADTVYAWVPGEGNDYVVLAFAAVDTAGEVIDFPLVCDAVDDGRFELPADARAFVEGSTDDLRLRYERVRQIVELADGVVFHTRTNVTE